MQNLADFHFGGPGSTYVDTKEWSWKDPKWADPSQQEEGHAAKCYEALLLMQQPQHAALLIEGRLTPRMRAKLAHAAGGMKENVELSLPDFKNFVPRDAREFNGDQGSVPGFESRSGETCPRPPIFFINSAGSARGTSRSSWKSTGRWNSRSTPSFGALRTGWWRWVRSPDLKRPRCSDFI